MITIAVVFLGLSFYLHSIDHPITKLNVAHQAPSIPLRINQTFTIPLYIVSTFIVSNYTASIYKIKPKPIETIQHPPFYANLWPETLEAGIILLLISVILLIRRKP
ncbi:hypothetical protein [Sulfurisphaera ohwakuensis]|uniref:Uncharacterized protein n=1 Tax=Sulfurisphaera ohwakuensis TaxID=69656 RepID=A0A650CL86_SULOH|nr:hypothetical protein [Sulfurisphaera ohwakuensis]MBB5254776.1 hypothetical protein [Sulfurisphaera ohwakuensis]QGR18237.1 hypothetical protein D1869_14355 [Sulfurisphaera ohwakuensis]